MRDADLAVLHTDFPTAIRLYAEADDEAGLRRVHRLALDFGRYRAACALRPRFGPADEEWHRFLRQRALPCAPMGGDVDAGFWVDEDLLGAVASELGEPLAPLLARTVRWMIASGSRHLAKHYVLARLSGDAVLIDELEDAYAVRARCPRERLVDAVRAEVPGPVEVLQRGDTHDDNPIAATVLRTRLDGRPVVLKENLRLPIDYARVDGTAQEAELLAELDHPGVARLRRVLRVAHHEVLVLDEVAGAQLAGPLAAAELKRVGAQLADTVAHLHGAGIAYLDLKARNVLYDGARTALVDFGMAQRCTGEVTSVLSTPAWIPPEVGRTFRATRAADVFQLGLLLAVLSTGLHPFARLQPDDTLPRDEQLARYTLKTLVEPPDLAALPPDLHSLVGRMLAADPARRPLAWEVGAELRKS